MTPDQREAMDEHMRAMTPTFQTTYYDAALAPHVESIEAVVAAADDAIRRVMAEGAAKHPPFGWAKRTDDEDIDKAIRHLLTFRLQRDGHSPRDGEDHVHNALCRIAMVIAKRRVK